MLQNIIRPPTSMSKKTHTIIKICNKTVINDKIKKLNEAQEIFKTFDQDRINYIFKYVAHEATKERVPLAKLAFEETRMGVFEDKVIKNSVAAELPLSKYLNTKTCDIIERDTTKGLIKVATPVGPVAALIPTTNPTSTAIIKSLFALKTRNAMIFLPHPRAAKCTAEAVRICHDAAVRAGAPIDILQSVEPTRENSEFVMKHSGIKHILATGGPQMVKAAYQSGVPALGVGAGNAAVIIDETADFDSAVGSIVLGKTFDNGVICASEQSIVIMESVYDKVIDMFKKRGVYFVEGNDKTVLGNYLIVDGHVNPDIVGQSAKKIAKDINITVPDNTVVLAAEVNKIGEIEPFSHEKLSPILGFYKASNFEEACCMAHNIVSYGGAGHTAAIYSNKKERIDYFALKMPAFHLMANMPTSLGAIGSAYNYNVDPSFTLGVGSIAGSSLSGNLKPENLLDIKTLAEGQAHIDWFKVPPAIYFNRNCTEEALDDLSRYGDLKRVIIITDKMMVEMGYIKRIINKLESNGFICSIFDNVMPDPNIETVRKGVELCKTFKPDTLICIGGGSPLDAGKMIRVLYENPNVSLEDLSARFVESRKRTSKFPEHGSLIKKVVCIPTTSGTGSETTAFSVITDDFGNKHPICSYRLTPDIAIIDSSFTDKLPKSLIAYAGLDSITHSVESYVSCVANDFTSPMSLQSLKLVFDNLEKSYNVGDIESRDKVHKGASMAGLAFTNAFLGITHALSHKIAAKYHLAHGLTNAIILPHVIKYNSSVSPTRQAYYPQYTHPIAIKKYVEIAKELGLSGSSDEEYVDNLIEAFIKLSRSVNTPTSFAEVGIDEEEYLKSIDEIAFNSFDDQCVLGNPRFPMVDELKVIIKDAYYGYKKPTL